MPFAASLLEGSGIIRRRLWPIHRSGMFSARRCRHMNAEAEAPGQARRCSRPISRPRQCLKHMSLFRESSNCLRARRLESVWTSPDLVPAPRAAVGSGAASLSSSLGFRSPPSLPSSSSSSLSLSSICSRVMQAAMCALATIVWSMSSGSNYLSEAESAICTCCRLPASREYQFARSSTWLFPVCQPTKLQFWVRAHKILPSRLTITAQLLVDAWLLTPRSSSSYFMWM